MICLIKTKINTYRNQVLNSEVRGFPAMMEMCHLLFPEISQLPTIANIEREVALLTRRRSFVFLLIGNSKMIEYIGKMISLCNLLMLKQKYTFRVFFLFEQVAAKETMVKLINTI